MATDFFIHNVAPGYTPATPRGAWDDTSSAIARMLDDGRRTGDTIQSRSCAETSTDGAWDILLVRAISAKLTAQTISGTLSGVLALWESDSAADMKLHLHVYVTQGDSDNVRGTLLSDWISTAEVSNYNWYMCGFGISSVALSSLAVSDNDRLVIEIGMRATNTVATSYTGNVGYGADATKPKIAVNQNNWNDGVGYFTFSGDIAFVTIAQRTTQAVTEVGFGGVGAQRHSQVFTEVLMPRSVPFRSSQVLAEVLYAGVAPQRHEQVVVEVLVPRPLTPEIQFDPDLDVSGETIGLTWVEFTDSAGNLHVSSKTPLDDPSNFYGGWKENDVAEWGTIRRSLSDWKGNYAGTTITWKLADTERKWRALLADVTTRFFLNRPIVIRMISDVERRKWHHTPPLP